MPYNQSWKLRAEAGKSQVQSQPGVHSLFHENPGKEGKKEGRKRERG